MGECFFWHRFTWVVPDKGPQSGSSSSGDCTVSYLRVSSTDAPGDVWKWFSDDATLELGTRPRHRVRVVEMFHDHRALAACKHVKQVSNSPSKARITTTAMQRQAETRPFNGRFFAFT